jgi:hypothetical protein
VSLSFGRLHDNYKIVIFGKTNFSVKKIGYQPVRAHGHAVATGRTRCVESQDQRAQVFRLPAGRTLLLF